MKCEAAPGDAFCRKNQRLTVRHTPDRLPHVANVERFQVVPLIAGNAKPGHHAAEEQQQSNQAKLASPMGDRGGMKS
ncbi:MAG: hypothetical protein HC804_01195 [Anaerolineae bacterium]|nr:hypothetical protein [Anaerolineae bacterium]